VSLVFFGVCIAIAIALVAVGARRVYRESLALKWRFAGYGALPIRIKVDETVARVAVTQRSIASLQVLFLRAGRARAEIVASLQRIAVMAKLVATYFRRPVRP
jgi:hypothetical protein